jgi:hypothetical protein
MVEIVFLMLVLKIPILYLVGVVWWAVRQEPLPEEPAQLAPAPAPRHPAGGPRRPTRGGPHAGGRAERRADKIRTR